MRFFRILFVPAVASIFWLAAPSSAQAVSPQNPYRTFNLSGINYGSLQWERAHRQGQRTWPTTNTTNRSVYRTGSVVVGTLGSGSVVEGGSSRSGRRFFRRR